jgi:phosphonate transport system permease protein
MNHTIAHEQAHIRLPKLRLLRTGRFWLIAAALALLASLAQAGVLQRDIMNPGGWPQVARFLRAALQPALAPDFLQLTLQASLITFAYAVCGLAISLGIGFVGGLLSSEVWWLSHRQANMRAPWFIMRGLLAVPRAIHEVIWGLFFINIFGLDPLSGILALGIPFGAITAKVFSEILDETPRGPLNALLTAGASPLKAFGYSLLPQALPNLLSYAFYRFECAIRSASVLGLIGAGGLGYQILLSLQSLRYEEMWTLIYALCLLSGLTDLWSARLRAYLEAPSRISLHTQPGEGATPHISSPHRVNVAALTFIAALVFVPLAFIYLQPNLGKLFAPRTFTLLGDVVRDSLPPDLSLTALRQLLAPSGQTLAMSVLAIALAGLLGFALSYLAARNLLLPAHEHLSPISRVLRHTVLALTRFVLLIWRAVPAPIWALMALFVFFPGILPGALALALHNGGILGRLMAETIENADERPMRALRAQGASAAQAVLYALVPLTAPQSLAYTLYRWEVCLRETVIVGLVGAGGLGRLLQEQLSSFDYRGVLASLIALLVLTFIVDVISALARRAVR